MNGEINVGYTCLRHELFTKVAKDLSPKALVALVKMLTYSKDFTIRSNYLATQLGIKESKHMTARTNELVDKGYLSKKGAGENTVWHLSSMSQGFKYCPKGNYFRLKNDAIERLISYLNEGEIIVYLYMLTNALVHKITNTEIEHRIGYNKSTVSRHLKKLDNLGFIHKEDGYWTIDKSRREEFIEIETDDELYQFYE